MTPGTPPTSAAPPLAAGEPYCGNCNYNLSGLTESPRCPECGRPLVEVLVRSRHGLSRGRRYTSSAAVFGWPVIQVALGPWPETGEVQGRAKALIAIGNVAYGGIAIGGNYAVGVVAIGGGAIGVCAIGGGAIGAVTALGGGAIGGFAVGGGAVGVLASGGGAIGFIAEGGGAIGWFAHGGAALGRHVIDVRRSDPAAVAVFDALSPVLGPPAAPMTMLPVLYAAGIPVLVSLIIAAVALWTIRCANRASLRSNKP